MARTKNSRKPARQSGTARPADDQHGRLVEWAWRKYREAKASGRADLVRERTGDLVRLYLPWVTRLAEQTLRRWVRRSDLVDDLIQAGSIGLLRAIDRFDPDRGRFRAFASPVVRNAMADCLRAMDHLTSSHREQVQQGTTPTVHLWSLETIRADSRGRRMKLVAMLPARPGSAPGGEMETAEFWWDVTRDCTHLERLAVFGTLRDRMTQAAVGRYLGVSGSRVGEIRRRAEERIARRYSRDELAELIPGIDD